MAMPPEIRCGRCGDTDGPFTRPDHEALCEECARPAPLTHPTEQ